MQLKLDSAIIRDCMFAGIVVDISITSGESQIGHATITTVVPRLQLLIMKLVEISVILLSVVHIGLINFKQGE
jgi:hypothetical protein